METLGVARHGVELDLIRHSLMLGDVFRQILSGQ
jgi:hypothetical protein